MTFIWVTMLWLLLLIPGFVVLYILLQRRRRKYALRYASLSLVKEALGSGPGKRRYIPPILFLIGLTISILAIARPAASITLPSMQGTVILTIDSSGSMNADDLKPSRLEAAKAAAKTFIAKQPSNVRIGVVSFSESTAIVQPPTTDRQAILAAITRLSAQRGTAIGRGILTSLDAIFEEPGKTTLTPTPSARNSLTPSQPKAPTRTLPRGTYASAAIVLLSDGQSNSGPPPLDIIGEAVNRGVRIYTVGVGSESGTILRFEGFSMRVKLDEETLKQIADKTDGEYFKASSETDLNKIYDDLSKQVIFKTEQTELTAFFTALAALLFIAAGIISMLWFNRLI
jgi:Ca-activated chloride channel homolog